MTRGMLFETSIGLGGTAMRYFGVIVVSLVIFGCATSPDVKPSTDVIADIMAPRVIYKVDPDYPTELRRAGVTGVVTIEATIDRSGQLLSPRVLRSSHPELEDLAMNAVSKWRFEPATKNGVPVDVLFQVEVTFPMP